MTPVTRTLDPRHTAEVVTTASPRQTYIQHHKVHAVTDGQIDDIGMKSDKCPYTPTTLYVLMYFRLETGVNYLQFGRNQSQIHTQRQTSCSTNQHPSQSLLTINTCFSIQESINNINLFNITKLTLLFIRTIGH